MSEPDRFLTLGEAADFLGVSTRTIRRMVSAGRLRGYRLGVLYRFQRVDLLAALHVVNGADEQVDDLTDFISASIAPSADAV